MSLDLYDRYHNFVQQILNKNDGDGITTFKRHPDYRYMLEHVSPDQGQLYLNIIFSKFPNITMEMIMSFCKLNDSIGSPKMSEYIFGYASPTSIRYILHTLLILEYIELLNLKICNLKLIELGGGYGGLCLCMNYFSKIKLNYTIIDLKYIGQLQKKYLEMNEINVNCLEPFGESLEGDDYFLISNYCFAEINITLQEKYIELLFPKVSYGFITWNEYLDPYDFGFDCNIIDEFPQTGEKNKYIYFKKRSLNT